MSRPVLRSTGAAMQARSGKQLLVRQTCPPLDSCWAWGATRRAYSEPKAQPAAARHQTLMQAMRSYKSSTQGKSVVPTRTGGSRRSSRTRVAACAHRQGSASQGRRQLSARCQSARSDLGQQGGCASNCWPYRTLTLPSQRLPEVWATMPILQSHRKKVVRRHY